MLDPIRARAEADAAERRGAGTLWGAGPVAWEGVSAGTVAQAEVVRTVEEGPAEDVPVRPRVAALRRAEAQPRATAEVPTALLAAILARLQMAPPATGGAPAWLVEAVGNPLGYDEASPLRKDVCARVDPALYRWLQAMKKRLGLRTTADDCGRLRARGSTYYAWGWRWGRGASVGVRRVRQATRDVNTTDYHPLRQAAGLASRRWRATVPTTVC